jgi:hypothetical protein
VELDIDTGIPAIALFTIAACVPATPLSRHFILKPAPEARRKLFFWERRLFSQVDDGAKAHIGDNWRDVISASFARRCAPCGKPSCRWPRAA